MSPAQTPSTAPARRPLARWASRLALVASAALPLAACQSNAWQNSFVPTADATFPSSDRVALVGMRYDEVHRTPPPPDQSRIGLCEFASDVGPSTDDLRAFALSAGATTVYWGREFANTVTETDYRTQPSFRSRSVRERTADGRTITYDDGYWDDDVIPSTRTDAWYRYAAVFFR